MTPEEFDLDFDFDKEYGYLNDPDKSDEDSDDFDLDAALARVLGPDFDEQFEREYESAQAALNQEAADNTPPAPQPEVEDETDHTRLFGFEDLEDEDEDAYLEETPEDDAPQEEDLTAVFAASFAAEQAMAEEEADEDEEPEWISDSDSEPEETDRRVRRERRAKPAGKGLDLNALKEKVDLKGISEKLNLKGIGEKAAGAGHVVADNGKRFFSALRECKPGKMTKKQKRRFKNNVLPFLLGGAAFLMCLIFIIGAAGRSMNSEERQQAALEASIAQAEAEQEAAQLIKDTLDNAARKAAGYDYQGAIDILDSYKTADRELTAEMTTAREAYTAAMSDLVVWDDPTAITNLSFHVLVADPNRAYRDPAYANSYRTKFVTVSEFSAILEQLYNNGYVLVNLDSCISATTDDAGNTTYTTKPIYLPQGKTPIMITETLVNYFEYMTDSDGDGAPDAGGAGFASRLVIEEGEIKAEYIDAGGNTLVGDYDLVPILNSFIDAHPDFTYRGAKAILAVTGDEGIFGWRTNKDDSLISGVQDIVEILRADGYQIASNSYSNLDYGTTSTNGITADLDSWAAEIEPILGQVDIMIIARGGSVEVPNSLGSASSRFGLIHEAGFHYIIDAASSATGKLTNEFFYQGRLMVVGSNLDSGIYDAYFDAASIKDQAR